MAIHTRPIEERLAWLWQLSQDHSAQYCDPENTLARQRYMAAHDTHIIALKCMDGRIHLPYVTQTPLGIISPFRNLGGIFDLGWPYLGDLLADEVGQAVKNGRRVLIIITYHYSRGAQARGCAGFNCDQAAAFQHAQAIQHQLHTIFGQSHQTVYPVVCGFETDDDALTLHGTHGERIDLAQWEPAQLGMLPARLAQVFPDMPAPVQRDFLPLLNGNVHHITEVRRSQRELDIEHREWMICLGRGFDFLHVPNIALIVGPFSPDLSHPIAQAAGIIRANMEQGRIPQDGFLLLSSAPYREPGSDHARAQLKAQFLANFAAQVITKAQPELAAKMITRTAVLQWSTRRLERFQAPQ